MDYQQVKNSVWVLRVTNHASVPSYLAGVCVDRNSILTFAHGIIGACTVWGRRMHEKDFVELETVYVRENWDLGMLRCKKWKVNELEFKWAKVSENENVMVQSKICHIGHPRGFVGTFHSGSTTYNCSEVHPSTFSDDYRMCKDHKSKRIRTPYLTMGQFINVKTLSRHGTDWSAEDYEFKKKLHPSVPMIACQGIPEESGCFGGPLYRRENGDVIGIVTHYVEGMAVAVHVSALKAFLVEAKMVGACGFKARFQRSIGGLKQGGRPRRGPGRDQVVSEPPGT